MLSASGEGKALRGFRLTERVRTRVKHPLGRLIVGSSEKTMETLKDIVEREKPTKLFAVGDSVTLSMMEHGVNADLYIIDNKIMRKPIEAISIKGMKTVGARNPAGMITIEAWEVIKEEMKNPSIKQIVIDGEEDLLTLPIIKFAPEGAMVVYGQPHVGIVLVRVTERKRKEIESLIEEMEVVDEN